MFNSSYAKENIENSYRLQYLNIPFWSNFNDEILIDGLSKLYDNNNDLKVTSLKVSEAQRLVKMSFANELPNIGFNGYVGHVFKSSDEVFGDITIPDYTESHFLLPLSMNYEIDIWGKNHLKTKSQYKNLEMVKQDEKSVYISLTSTFAGDYFTLIKIDKLISIQKELISVQLKLCDAVKKRYEIGTANINDVIETQKDLTYLTERMQFLEEKQDVLQNQINVLLADRAFSPVQRMPYEKIDMSLPIPQTIQIDSISSRPDWIKSELNLERIGINVKVAKKELLPSFVLNGNLGFNAYSIASSNTFLANLGVAPTMDLFMGGRKIQFLKLQKDNYEIGLQHYNKVVLTSIQETNDALYSLKSTHKKYLISNNRYNLDTHKLSLVQRQENIGTADNVDLLIKRQEQLLSEQNAVSLKINEIIAFINLYQALGGMNLYQVEKI